MDVTEVNVVLLFVYFNRVTDFSSMPAGEINFYQCSRKVIEERFCPYVNDAVVFLDDSSAEVIHWHGGASTLFDYGALDVREFSSFEVCKTAQLILCCII